MKKGIVMMLAFLIIGSASAIAQKGASKKEAKLEAKKAFINEKLSLTESEQEKFWPLQEAMRLELKENRKQFKEDRPDKGDKIDDMSDAEVAKMLSSGFDMKQKDIEIRRSYNEKYIAVIGVKRTAKMYHMEREFKKSQNGKGAPKSGGPNK